jgi:hypothetical protein
MKRRWLMCGALAVIGLTLLTGCDVFQIHESNYGDESGIIVEGEAKGNVAGAGGTQVGDRSVAGAKEQLTGTSTQRLGTGYGGPVSTPGPGRQGR